MLSVVRESIIITLASWMILILFQVELIVLALSLSRWLTDMVKVETDVVEKSPFNWEKYLADRGLSLAKDSAPPDCFYQSLIPPENRFQPEYHLKVKDSKAKNLVYLAEVVQTEGPRICLRLQFTYKENQFWAMCDSEYIQPLDDLDMVGTGLQCPSEGLMILPETFHAKLRGVLKTCKPAPKDWFVEPPETKPVRNGFQSGQKLELADPQDWSSTIWPGTVVAVDDVNIIVRFDDWDKKFDVEISYDSRDIFPCGWAEKAHHPMMSRKILNELSPKPFVAGKQEIPSDTSGGSEMDPTPNPPLPTVSSSKSAPTGQLPNLANIFPSVEIPVCSAVAEKVPKREVITPEPSEKRVSRQPTRLAIKRRSDAAPSEPLNKKPRLKVISKESSVKEVVEWLDQFKSIHVGTVGDTFRVHKITGVGILLLKGQSIEFLQDRLGLLLGAALELFSWLKEIPEEKGNQLEQL